jgi:polyferredoxin
MRRALGIIIALGGILVVVSGLAIVIFADAETSVGQLIVGESVVLLGLFVTAIGWFLRPPR